MAQAGSGAAAAKPAAAAAKPAAATAPAAPAATPAAQAVQAIPARKPGAGKKRKADARLAERGDLLIPDSQLFTQLQDAERRVDMLISRKKHELQEMYASFRRGAPRSPNCLTLHILHVCCCPEQLPSSWSCCSAAVPTAIATAPQQAGMLAHCEGAAASSLLQARPAVRRRLARRARSCGSTSAPSTTTSRWGPAGRCPAALWGRATAQWGCLACCSLLEPWHQLTLPAVPTTTCRMRQMQRSRRRGRWSSTAACWARHRRPVSLACRAQSAG